MPIKYTYLLVDFFCILFPFAFSFYPKINFYKQWKYFLAPAGVTALFFIVWDILFTKMGVWGFNPARYVCGLYLFSLPLEEYLFFFCIPYSCVFTYYCIRMVFPHPRFNFFIKVFSIALAVFLFTIAFTHLPRLYTSVTFILLAAFLCLLTIKKTAYLPAFFISFLIILIPFFMANGILTGSFIPEPVVIYNNKYNLGIRLSTIPAEDVFYGMLLMLMNVAVLSILKKDTIFNIFKLLQLYNINRGAYLNYFHKLASKVAISI